MSAAEKQLILRQLIELLSDSDLNLRGLGQRHRQYRRRRRGGNSGARCQWALEEGPRWGASKAAGE
jgi:hypothetical protein